MRSSKSRSRNKNNRNRSVGNVVNRVFDSSGPEGKVRGTPQQIIDKYNQLARDAQLAGDRVATENFQQHAEHYLRMLGEAQKEQDARREEQERQNRERQAQRDRERAERQERESNSQPGSDEQPPAAAFVPSDPQPVIEDPASAPQPDVIEFTAPPEGESGLVETPENTEAPKPKRSRSPRKPKAEAGEEAAETEAKPKAKPRRRAAKPKAEASEAAEQPSDGSPSEAAE